ncbi:MAG TPA: DoxX family protein [Candidatus Babeliales bacterium]|nr:DoxX family protein [Candidatus Babeliales bacterium]
MCKEFLHWTMHNSLALQHIGFTLIRMAIGCMFLIFGWNKLMSGSANLTQIGSAISYFGIMHGFLLFGYLAALTELCGGAAYVLGFCTRIVSLPMIFLLIVAIKFHLQQHDTFTKWSFPALCLCIVIGFLIAGSGKYSLDYILSTHAPSGERNNYH